MPRKSKNKSQKDKKFSQVNLVTNSAIASVGTGAAVMTTTGAVSLIVGAAVIGGIVSYMATNEIPKN